MPPRTFTHSSQRVGMLLIFQSISFWEMHVRPLFNSCLPQVINYQWRIHGLEHTFQPCPSNELSYSGLVNQLASQWPRSPPPQRSQRTSSPRYLYPVMPHDRGMLKSLRLYKQIPSHTIIEPPSIHPSRLHYLLHTAFPGIFSPIRALL